MSWSLRFSVSFRDLEQMLAERGVLVDHVSLHRRVRRFAPELERRVRPHLTPVGRGWHADEDPNLLAKSRGYMAAHTAAGSQLALVTWNRRNRAERSQMAQPRTHIARTAVVPS